MRLNSTEQYILEQLRRLFKMKNKLNSKIIIEKIKQEKEKLKEKGVKKIGLFGSYAKGNPKKGSDIDFLVEFKNISAEKLFGRKVDIVEINSLREELNYVKEEVKYVKI